MLSEAQQRRVWEGMLGAEIRAYYFADLSSRLYARQKWSTWAILLLTSGSAATVLASLPSDWTWIRIPFTLLAAAISLYSAIMQSQKFAVDASDLHARWQRLSKDYEALWENVYVEDAVERLRSLDDRAVEVSKAGTIFRYNKKAMLKWEQHVVSYRLANAPA
ncbi:MAG: hypothetical protein P4L40_09845 [Terracidiphilus sp.]|nr:hypothetical protein [Terracidiphilus sp.]